MAGFEDGLSHVARNASSMWKPSVYPPGEFNLSTARNLIVTTL